MVTFEVEKNGVNVGTMVFAASRYHSDFRNDIGNNLQCGGCTDVSGSGSAGCDSREFGVDVYGNHGSITQMSKLWDYVDGCAITLADGLVTSAAVALAMMLALWLGGCAQVGQFATGDAQNAAAIATAVGDSAGAACWPVLATAGNAIAPSEIHRVY
jgi:hypothetical protein